MSSEVRVAAPATVANVGPGFDVFGFALDGPLDTVTARRAGDAVRIVSCESPEGELPTDPARNSVGVAARAALASVRARTGEDPGGLELEVVKGTPLASGVGSSAASAAAGVGVVDALFPDVLTLEDKLAACLDAEEAVAGRHLDNVAPALLGGFVLVAATDPPRVHRVVPAFELVVALAKPPFGLPTRESREALPDQVPLGNMVAHLAGVAEMVHALHAGDRQAFLAGMIDRVLVPARSPLIPGYEAATGAAREAGAEYAGISGGGPSLVAVCPDREVAARARDAMAEAFGPGTRAWVAALSPEGARRVGT
jgi:homoserine kinase